MTGVQAAEVERVSEILSLAAAGAASLDSATTSEDTAPIAPSFSLTIEAEHNSDIIMASAVSSSLTCLTRPDLNPKLFPP